MPPCYAISSYFSILFASYGKYLVLIRDIYEAILLFSFFYLMFAYIAFDNSKKTITEKRVYQVLSE